MKVKTMFRIKKELKITILSILLTGLILSIAVNLKAGAEQTTVNVITRIQININTLDSGTPYQSNQAINNTSGLYTIRQIWEINEGSGYTQVQNGQLITNNNVANRLTITINANEGTIFCEEAVFLLGQSPTNWRNDNRVEWTEKAIIYQRYEQNRIPTAATFRHLVPPEPPTYHTILVNAPIDPTPTPPPTPEPPELPDLREISEVIIYAADLVIHAKSIQTVDIKSAIAEQTEQMIQAMQHDYQDNENLIVAIEEQTEQINALMQHNFNMTIVFSLVTIGAIVGLGFLIAWRPTHD